MLSTTTNTVDTTLLYEDYEERTYKVPVKGEITGEVYNNIKTRIREFNTAAQDNTSSVKQTFVSESGGKVVRIKSATLTQRTEDVIYSG